MSASVKIEIVTAEGMRVTVEAVGHANEHSSSVAEKAMGVMTAALEKLKAEKKP